jgi:pilus assembly protein Flp/PilA
MYSSRTTDISGEIHEKGAADMLFAVKGRKAHGQGLVEYALILVLVAIVVIAALMILGPILGNTFSTINTSLVSV